MPEMLERLQDEIAQRPAARLELTGMGQDEELQMEVLCPHCPAHHGAVLSAQMADRFSRETEFAGAEIEKVCPETGKLYEALLAPQTLRAWQTRREQKPQGQTR